MCTGLQDLAVKMGNRALTQMHMCSLGVLGHWHLSGPIVFDQKFSEVQLLNYRSLSRFFWEIFVDRTHHGSCCGVCDFSDEHQRSHSRPEEIKIDRLVMNRVSFPHRLLTIKILDRSFDFLKMYVQLSLARRLFKSRASLISLLIY